MTLIRGAAPILEAGIYCTMPILDQSLGELILGNLGAGYLRFAVDNAASVILGDIQLATVGTRLGEDGSAVLKIILAAARKIGCIMACRESAVNFYQGFVRTITYFDNSLTLNS